MDDRKSVFSKLYGSFNEYLPSSNSTLIMVDTQRYNRILSLASGSSVLGGRSAHILHQPTSEREHLGQPLSDGAGVGDSPARGTEEGRPHQGSTMGKGMKNMTLWESRVSS